MSKLLNVFIVVLLLSSSIDIIAQVPVEKSDKTIVLFGKTYYLHEVKKGQTYYSICNTYGVEEADIYSANTGLATSGLKYGMTIKIPALTNNYIENQEVFENTDAPANNYIYHEVMPSETLFSLAQHYGVEISDIESTNPELAEGILKIGQIIKIPTRNSYNSEILKVDREDFDINEYYRSSNINNTNEPCTAFNYNSNKIFKIAVLLPLFIQENTRLKNQDEYYQNSGRFFEFYHGLLLAAKQMKIEGLSVEFYLKDTRASTATTKSILQKEQMQDMDLIIGPVHSANFKIASDFARNNRINIVAPFQLREYSKALSNPYVFIASPNENTEIANISTFLTKSYDKSVLMLHNGTAKEAEKIKLFRKNLILAALPYNDIHEIVFKSVNYKTGHKSSIENALSLGLYNIVIVPSNDQVFITDMVTKLNYLTKRYKIVLYGLHAWEKLRNIEISYLRNLRFHYGTSSYVNSKNQDVKIFKKRYKAYFNGIPSTYACMGYDISYYFMNLLKDYGKDFQFCVQSTSNKKYSKGLQYDFNFRRDIPFEGFENDWVRIVEIDKELELHKVN